ncbi:MAG: argininosuccinate synthase [Candidatus Dormibacteria bacterium]
MPRKVVLAYSGGLDTSVCIPWIREHYDAEVVTLSIDLGAQKDLEGAQQRALRSGATRAIVVDAREVFLRQFAWPTLQAGALYEGVYPLATALSRPLIAALQVEVAREEGADAIAHGCTGKGNDQVRFDVATAALAPDLQVVAPVREWRMNRDDEIEYARQHGIEVPATVESPYSVDENLWGRSIEAGVLEDPWEEPPADVYLWTADPRQAPPEPELVEIGFERGVPVALDGREVGPVELVTELNRRGGAHGVGRIDHVENRLVGIKSREIYEAPAAVILTQAHAALESLTLPRDVAHYKEGVAAEWGRLTYNGLWFSGLRQSLGALVAHTQQHVSGEVRIKMYRGNAAVVGRKARASLYRVDLATYGREDAFDHEAAAGFIKLWGLPLRTEATVQHLLGGAHGLGLLGQVKQLAAGREG